MSICAGGVSGRCKMPATKRVGRRETDHTESEKELCASHARVFVRLALALLNSNNIEAFWAQQISMRRD